MFHWNIFNELARDRPQQSLSLGMAGGTLIPMVISRDRIRAAGVEAGLEGDDLADFVEILLAIDDYDVERRTKRIADETRAAAARMKRGGR